MATSKGTKIFLIVGGILIALFLVGIIGLFLLADTMSRPSVPENAVLVLSVSGSLPDYVPEDDLGKALGIGQQQSFSSLLTQLRKAKVDKRVGGLMLDINFPGIGWGKAYELREAIADFKQSGKPVKATAVPTSPDLATELSMIDAYYQGHKSLKGMFAVDAGDTQGVGQVIQKYKLQGKVKGGGYDLLPGTLKLIQNGSLQFTIDQQPYLQGYYPVMQLFLQRLSGGLVAPSDTNTGLLFVTKDNVKPYLNTKTRYHGSSKAHKYPVS